MSTTNIIDASKKRTPWLARLLAQDCNDTSALLYQSYQEEKDFQSSFNYYFVNYIKKQQKNNLLNNHLNSESNNKNQISENETQTKLHPSKYLRILIVGDKGQLGSAFKSILQFYNYDIICVNRDDFDLTDQSKLDAFLQQKLLADLPLATLPFVIINAAAYTAVDKAEQPEEQATVLAVNERLPAQLADFCNQHGGLLIHFSTDYVFNGNVPNNEYLHQRFFAQEELQELAADYRFLYYREIDPVSPINFYGKSKFLGEEAIRQHTKRHFIFRVSWVFDDVHANFLTTMLKLANRQPPQPLRVVGNQYSAPNLTFNIVDATLYTIFKYCRHMMWDITNEAQRHEEEDSKYPVLDDYVKSIDLCGTYSLANPALTSYHDFAALIFKHFNKKVDLHPIMAEEYPTIAPRPYFSGMHTRRFEHFFFYSFKNWAKWPTYFPENM